MYHEYLEAKDDADRETVIRSILHLARRPPPLSPVFDEVKPFILPRVCVFDDEMQWISSLFTFRSDIYRTMRYIGCNAK